MVQDLNSLAASVFQTSQSRRSFIYYFITFVLKIYIIRSNAPLPKYDQNFKDLREISSIVHREIIKKERNGNR